MTSFSLDVPYMSPRELHQYVKVFLNWKGLNQLVVFTIRCLTDILNKETKEGMAIKDWNSNKISSKMAESGNDAWCADRKLLYANVSCKLL